MSEALVFKIDLNCSRLRLFLFISGEFPHVTLDHNVFFTYLKKTSVCVCLNN